MSQDPACKGSNEAETVVVAGGDLANVFVYVKDGLGSRTFDVPKDPVVLDQSGCKLSSPRAGVMAGQTVQIRTTIRPRTTSIHAKDNREWNDRSRRGRSNREELCPRRNHASREVQPAPWMRCTFNVVKSPFYASPTRAASMKSRACHRAITHRLRPRKTRRTDQKITVAPKDSKTADQTFKAGE